jgi:Protein of unknown function (DUF3616)
MRAKLSLVVAALACVTQSPAQAAADLSAPLIYQGVCDASGAVPVGTTMFAVADDEVNQIRLYHRDRGGPPVAVLDLTAFLEVDPKSPESDLEAGARLGSRAYWIGSHSRNHRGHLRPNRNRFFATDIHETPRGVELMPVGKPYKNLLRDLLDEPRLSRFDLATAARRMPKSAGGLNIEGLCATPDHHLLIGFRNPIPGGRALLVPLLNPDAVIEGQTARFGDPMLLDLGGLGIRDIAFWRGTYLISAGSYGGRGPFRLYEWSGGDAKPRPLPGIQFGDMHPEAIIIYPDKGLKEFQVLSDDGTRVIDDCPCKRLPEASKRFRAVWITPG